MDDAIAKIKERIDIVDFIQNYLPLKRAGKNFKALCPFHQEKTPSFIVSPERQIWRCFGACQEGGDVIKFYMKWENIDFIEAVKELAERLNIKVRFKKTSGIGRSLREKILEVNKKIADVYAHILLKTSAGKRAKDYLIKERGINQGIIEKFGIGYAPEDEEFIPNFFLEKGLDRRLLVKTGVFIQRRDKLIDRLSGRLIFPLKNHKGEVLGFSGRIIQSEADEAKYINIPETEVYRKRESLFGIDQALEHIREEGRVFIVEGEFDMIRPFQEGIKNIVAIKGSTLTQDQTKILKRFAKRLVLLLDSDEAGTNAAVRTLEVIKDLQVEVYVVRLDFAKDPDEAVKKDFLRFKRILQRPLVIYEFVLNVLEGRFSLNDPFARSEFIKESAYVLSLIKNPVVRDFYARYLSDKLELDKRLLEIEIRKNSRRRVWRRKESDISKADRQMLLLGIVLQSDEPCEYVDKIFSILENKDFSSEGVRDIFVALKKECSRGSIKTDKFINLLPPALKDLAEQAYLYPDAFEKTEVVVDKIVYFLKIQSLKNQLKKELEEEGDKRKLKKLSDEIRRYERKYIGF